MCPLRRVIEEFSWAGYEEGMNLAKSNAAPLDVPQVFFLLVVQNVGLFSASLNFRGGGGLPTTCLLNFDIPSFHSILVLTARWNG